MEFKDAIRRNVVVQRLRKRVEDGTATQKDLYKLADAAGDIASDSIADQLQTEYPDGQIPEEDVRRIVSPIMKQCYQFITELVSAYQNDQYQKAGVGLKAVAPEYSRSRESELVAELSRRSFANDPERHD